MSQLRPIASLAFALAAAAPCRAAPELAPLFRDHAVLQCDKPVPVWGLAAPGEHVSVAFGGQSVGATAGPDGRWITFLSLRLGPDGYGEGVRHDP